MKKNATTPTIIIFLFFAIVLIGSNICCTGRASNNEKVLATSVDKNNSSASETNAGRVKTLTENNFNENIKSGIVLVDFWATWCMPCRMQSPIIEKVSNETVGKVSVFKVDIDQSPEIAERFNVQSIPTLIVFKDGKIVDQFEGLTQKEDIIKAIEKLSKK